MPAGRVHLSVDEARKIVGVVFVGLQFFRQCEPLQARPGGNPGPPSAALALCHEENRGGGRSAPRLIRKLAASQSLYNI